MELYLFSPPQMIENSILMTREDVDFNRMTHYHHHSSFDIETSRIIFAWDKFFNEYYHPVKNMEDILNIIGYDYITIEEL